MIRAAQIENSIQQAYSDRTMTIVFRIHQADFVSAHWAYILRHRFHFIYAYSLPLFMVAVAMIVVLEYPESWPKVGQLIVIGTGMIAWVLFVYWRNWIRRFGNGRFGHQIVTAEVNADGVRTRIQTRQATYTWEAFSDIYESRRVFVFLRRDATFVFFPKSEMNSGQQEELRGLITSNAKGKVKLQRHRASV
jgi:YcxB-like protein